MIITNIKFAIRNLLKNKVYSFINIIGFAFSIGVFLMISAYLLHEYSFDTYHKNSKNIYKLINLKENTSAIDYRVSEKLREGFPEINNSCLSQTIFYPISVKTENSGKYINNLMSVDNRFFQMFTVTFLKGNPEVPLPTINSAVITESTAEKLFGKKDPIGKEINISERTTLIISGIIKDFPDNSSLNANIIVNAENDKHKFAFMCESSADKSTYRYPFNIYFELKENVDADDFVKNINKNSELFQPFVKNLGIIPLEKMHLEDNTQRADIIKGNPFLLKLMFAIAVIILLLAIINYVNLAVAQQSKMNKQIGIKKVVGANKKDIINSFLVESLIVSIISLGLGLVLFSLGKTFFSNIINFNLNENILFEFPHNIYLLLFVLGLSLLIGIIPGIIFSSFNPIYILGSSLIKKRKSVFRSILTVFQFVVAIVLIFCVTVIYKQINFVKNKNIGFEKEQLLKISFPRVNKNDKNKAFVFVDKLKQYKGIKNVTLSACVPGEVTSKVGFGKEYKKWISIIRADLEFLNTFKIKQIMGRKLLKGDLGKVCMFNKKAYETLQWKDLKNKKFNNTMPANLEVMGILENFNFASLHNNIEPLCVIFDKLNYPSDISIRIAKGKINTTMAYINKIWQEMLPYYPFEYRFYDDWFDSMYRNEERFAKGISIFALLAICISCLGILGLAIFTTENSTKEIGIRKVFGAKVSELIIMLNLDYIKWIAIAAVISLPIAWIIMKDWLEDFAYKTEINWWVFLLSGSLAFIIALLTVSFQTYRVAMADPVESLKDE